MNAGGWRSQAIFHGIAVLLASGCTLAGPEEAGSAGLAAAAPRAELNLGSTAAPAPAPATAPSAGASCSAAADADNLDSENLAKYARYRARLRNEFIYLSPHDEPGSNLAASKRQGTTLSWSDATIMHAQYLSLLATEYALYAGRDAAKAELAARELHWALRALDRLDRSAESYFRPDRSVAATDLNGFFIRDDVDGDLLATRPIAAATAVESDVTAPYGGQPGYFATEMSQDQVWHLTMGLALVKKLAPFVGELDGEAIDLRAHAKTIAARMLRYMRDHDRWRTQNPIFGVDVLRGAEMDARRVFSYGFAEAGNFILSADQAGDPLYPSLHDTASRLAEPFFRLASVAESDNYNQRVLATVGDINYAVGLFAWGGTLWKLEHETLSRTLFRYEHFPLVYVLLHGGETRLSPQIYGGLLNAAPADGPFNHGDGTHVCAWSSTSRLVWPESNDAPEAWKQGDYNGIDYMLLHNLYQLVFNADRLDALYRP